MFFKPTEKKINIWEEKGKTKKIVDVINHESAEIRLAAVNALGRMGEFETKEMILSKTEDVNNNVQCAAIEALEKFPFPDVVDVIKKHLNNSKTKQSADQTLRVIADYLSTNIEKSIKFMMEMELPDISPHKIMHDRIEQLVTIGEPARRSVLAALEKSDSLDQLVAAAVLGRLQSTEAMKALIDQLAYATEDVKDQIILSLKKYGESMVGPLLDSLSEGRDYENLKKVCKLLSDFPEQTKGHLVNLIKINRFKYGNLASIFIEEWKWQPETEEEKVMHSLINGTKDYANYPEIAGPWLMGDYANQEWSVRNDAIIKLAILNYSKAIPILIQALADAEGEVVISACRAIAKLELKKAKDKLVAIVQDENPLLRKEAAKSLRAIGELTWSNGIKGMLSDYETLLMNHSKKALDLLISKMESGEFEERLQSAKIIINRAKVDPDFFKNHWTKLHQLITCQRQNSHSDETEYRSSDCDYHSDYHSDNGIGLKFPVKADKDF